MKTFLQNVGLVLVSAVIALAGIEIGLRIWGPDVLVMGNQFVFYRYDPVLGWSNLPNMQGQFSRIEFSYPVQINSLGMRDVEPGGARKGEFKVAFMGDSFTWGVGAAYGERFTEVVEALDPRINALNFGVSGFAPVQYLLQIDQALALKPDYVIVVLCLGNDLSDNVLVDPYGHAKPVAKLSPDGSKFEIGGYPLKENSEFGPRLFGGGSTFRIVGFIDQQLDRLRRQQAREEAGGAPAQNPIVAYFKRRFERITRVEPGLFELVDANQALYMPTDKLNAEQREKVDAMHKVNELLLDAIRHKVEAAIGPDRFAVLLAPTKFEYGMERVPPGSDPALVAERVRAGLARLGIPAIDGRLAIGPADFWKVDAHWRPAGHQKIGKLVVEHLSAVMASAPPVQ